MLAERRKLNLLWPGDLDFRLDAALNSIRPKERKYVKRISCEIGQALRFYMILLKKEYDLLDTILLSLVNFLEIKKKIVYNFVVFDIDLKSRSIY